MAYDTQARKRGRARFTATVLSLAFLTILTGTAGAATYYVDNQNPAASDAGPGTPATPYRTISAAVSQHGGPGTTILVSPGTYREQVSVSASGASGQPFVLHATGAGVRVEGADDYSASDLWVLVSGNVWLASSVTWDPKQVFVDGARLAPSMDAPASIPANTFEWVSGTGLYMNLGGGSPGSHDTQVGHRNYGFTMFTKSWIEIEGFDVRHASDRGIYLQTNCTNVGVTGNRVSWSASYGIQAVGGSDLRIEGNRVSDNGNHGIGLINGATNCTVADNESFRNVNPLQRVANGIYLFGAPGAHLLRNNCHHNQDTGLEVDGGSNDVVSVNNVSWANADHGYDHLASSNAVHVDDVAYGNFLDGFSWENNSQNGRMANCISVNNGITTTGGADLRVDAGSTLGFAGDYDLIWNQTTTTPIVFGGVFYSTVAAYQAATGNETHGIQSDPAFSNPTAGDFRLNAGSPAIDAANSAAASWPAADAAGHARFDDPASPNHGAGPIAYADLGALEFQGTGGGGGTDHAPVVSAPSLVSVYEAAWLQVDVTASDPDGDAITSLTADLSHLPAGNNATFTSNDTHTGGTLRWQPTYNDSGLYTVSFRAANALSGTASTVIHVLNVDRAPIVSAPNNLFVLPGGTVSFTVTARDPDGDAIQSLTMIPFHMPINSGATFVLTSSDHTRGTFTWSVGEFTGNFKVVFQASNQLTGAASTNLHIKGQHRLGAEEVANAESMGDPDVPAALELSSAYPNPSAQETWFDLSLPRAARVSWTIYDLQGRAVWSEERFLGAGRARLEWKGASADQARVIHGVYLARVKVGEVEFTRRLIRF
jgi:parallel beta-helix repeat protein